MHVIPLLCWILSLVWATFVLTNNIPLSVIFLRGLKATWLEAGEFQTMLLEKQPCFTRKDHTRKFALHTWLRTKGKSLRDTLTAFLLLAKNSSSSSVSPTWICPLKIPTVAGTAPFVLTIPSTSLAMLK